MCWKKYLVSFLKASYYTLKIGIKIIYIFFEWCQYVLLKTSDHCEHEFNKSSDLPGLKHLLNGHTFNNIGSYGCLLERFKSK